MGVTLKKLSNELLFGIICSILIFRVLAQDNKEVTSRLRRGRSCRAAFNGPGECVSIRDCEPLIRLLMRNPLIGQQLVYQFSCPRSSIRYAVCCPYKKKDNQTAATSNSNNKDSKTVKPLRPPQCGQSSALHNRVVGGNPAELGAWPWIALLGYGASTSNYVAFKCGGTLVSSRTVITAAHCVHNQDNLRIVRLGEHDLAKKDESNSVNYVIQKKIVYPTFNPDTLEDDIALLILEKDVEFTDTIQPICLPVPDDVKNRNFVRSFPFVAGWGATRYKGPASTVLRETQVPVIDTNKCKAQYRTITNMAVTDHSICAGYTQGGKDACQGDSGGPLMFPVNKTYYLIGVVSGGYECGNPGFAGVYARVTSFLDFILKNLQ